MKRIIPLLVVFIGTANCSRPSHVIIDADPATGAATAYGTVLLDGPSERAVIAAVVGTTQPVGVTVWTLQKQCDVVTIHAASGDTTHDLAPDDVWTPSGSDRTLSFTLTRDTLNELATSPGGIFVCDARWTLDDEDRRVLAEVVDASR